MKEFADKVVVITGAGSGIGRALALNFASKGARLALNDYDPKGLQATTELLLANCQHFTSEFDVSKKESVYQFAEEVKEHFGRADVLINNAGVGLSKFRTDEVSPEDYEWMMGINVWGVIYGSLAFLPLLRKQSEASLVNISSAFGIYGIPYQTPYSTAKFAVRGFTESLAMEEKLNKTNLHIASVHPGGIKTNISKNARHADQHPQAMENFEKMLRMSSEDAAAAIISGIKRKKMRILVGNDAKLFWLLSKMPSWFIQRFIQMMDNRVKK